MTKLVGSFQVQSIWVAENELLRCSGRPSGLSHTRAYAFIHIWARGVKGRQKGKGKRDEFFETFLKDLLNDVTWDRWGWGWAVGSKEHGVEAPHSVVRDGKHSPLPCLGVCGLHSPNFGVTACLLSVCLYSCDSCFVERLLLSVLCLQGLSEWQTDRGPRECKVCSAACACVSKGFPCCAGSSTLCVLP